MPNPLPEEFPVAQDRVAKYAFARDGDGRGLQRWTRYIRPGDANPNKRDAAELTKLALRRWREGRAKRFVANTIEDVKDLIRDNPNVEVAALVLAKTPWFRRATTVGTCHFRRTWCNNVCVDFLTVHPLIVGNRASPIRGVGTGLLYYVTCVANEIDANNVWLEATQNSAPFYKKVFGRRSKVGDLLVLTKAEYNAFRVQTESKYKNVAEVPGTLTT